MAGTDLHADRTPGEPSLRAVVELVPDLLRRDPVDLAVRLRDQYGYIVKLPPFHPALDTDIYLVSHPDDVQRVLQTEPGKFGPLDVPGAEDFGRVVGDSIVNLSPERASGSWLKRTRMLNPEFTAQATAAEVPALIETTLATLAALADGHVADGDPATVPEPARVEAADGIRLLPAMRRLSLRLVGVSLLGRDLQAHETEVIDAVDTLRTAFKRRQLRPVSGRVSRHLPEELHLPKFLRDRLGDPSIVLSRHHGQTKAAIDQLEEVAEQIVARRERSPRAFDDGLGTWLIRPDPVSGDTLSPTTLQGEVVGLLIAGHATTSAALAWAFCLLAGRPEVQERINREARTTELLAPYRVARAADADAYSDTVDDGEGEVFLDALPFTRRVWQETLRLYPTLPMFGRTAKESLTLGEAAIPEGAQILVSPYVTHRDPAFWPEPNQFDPARFRPDRVADRHEFAYFPFSGGRHACLGEAVATTEALVVLATTLATHSVEFVEPADATLPEAGPGTGIGVDSAINLQPDRDVIVRLVPRDPERP